MILGDTVALLETVHGWHHHFGTAGQPSVALAEEACRRLQRFAFVGLTDAWEATICLFHASFGGEPHEAELVNTRRQERTRGRVPRLHATRPGLLLQPA